MKPIIFQQRGAVHLELGNIHDEIEMSSRLDISAPPNVRAKTDIDLFSFDAYGFETTLNSPENGIKDDVGTVLLRVRENRPSTFIENATTHGPVTRTTPEAI